MVLSLWIFWFGENSFFSNNEFHTKCSKRLEVFVCRAAAGVRDSQTGHLCVSLPALRTVWWCPLPLQIHPHQQPSHIAVMATKSELQTMAMVNERWQLRCIICAQYGTTSFSIWSQELQMRLRAALSGEHTALPIASPPGTRTTTKCETLNVTFPSVLLMDGA